MADTPETHNVVTIMGEKGFLHLRAGLSSSGGSFNQAREDFKDLEFSNRTIEMRKIIGSTDWSNEEIRNASVEFGVPIG